MVFMQTLQGSILSLQASTVSVHGPPRLYFEPQKLRIRKPCSSNRSSLCWTHQATTHFISIMHLFGPNRLKFNTLLLDVLGRRIPHVSNSQFVKNSSKRHSPRILRFLEKIRFAVRIGNFSPMCLQSSFRMSMSADWMAENTSSAIPKHQNNNTV